MRNKLENEQGVFYALSTDDGRRVALQIDDNRQVIEWELSPAVVLELIAVLQAALQDVEKVVRK